MDQYCVVVCGLQAGASDAASAWLPVAAALKLDPADFARRVVAALPRIVRRGLDRATAERVVLLLQAMHVDARALPDDSQLAYVDRAGSTRGPLPRSSLGEFLHPDEWYRLHGDTAWLPWPGPVEQEAPAASTPTIESDEVDDPAPSPMPDDELIDATATHETSNDLDGAAPYERPLSPEDQPQRTMPTAPPSEDGDDVNSTTRNALPTSADDELPNAMPPPLPKPANMQQPAPTPPDGSETTEQAMGEVESASDDELVNPENETPAPGNPDASATLPQGAEVPAPARSRAGRLLVLVVLAGLAVWAYRHWMTDTRMDTSPAAPAVIHPSGRASGQPGAPARVVPSHDSEPAPIPAASAPSAPAPTTTAASPAAATSTPTATATARTHSASLPAAATTTPPATVAAPTPAATNATAAAISLVAAGRLPASAGTIISARPAPAATTSTRKSAMPGH